MLYPSDIYQVNFKELYENLISKIREEQRHRGAQLPEHRRAKSNLERLYQQADIDADVARIIKSLFDKNPDFYPSCIIAVGNKAETPARLIKNRFPDLAGKKIIVFNNTDECRSQIQELSGQRIVLVDDVGNTCKGIQQIKKLMAPSNNLKQLLY